MAVTATCKECGGTGWVNVRTSRGKAVERCQCYSRELASSRFLEVGLPPKVAGLTFDNFSAGDSKTEWAKYNVLTRAINQAMCFAEEFPACKRKGLLFHGGRASERTHLAVATLKMFMQRGLSCLFCDYSQLVDRLRWRMNPEPAEAQAGRDLAKRVESVDVLLIDSLGDYRATNWVLDTIGAIIRDRYYQERCLLATTSLPLEGTAYNAIEGFQEMRLPTRYHDTLPDRIGRDGAERLLAHCQPLGVSFPEETLGQVSRTHSAARPGKAD